MSAVKPLITEIRKNEPKCMGWGSASARKRQSYRESVSRTQLGFASKISFTSSILPLLAASMTSAMGEGGGGGGAGAVLYRAVEGGSGQRRFADCLSLAATHAVLHQERVAWALAANGSSEGLGGARPRCASPRLCCRWTTVGCPLPNNLPLRDPLQASTTEVTVFYYSSLTTENTEVSVQYCNLSHSRKTLISKKEHRIGYFFSWMTKTRGLLPKKIVNRNNPSTTDRAADDSRQQRLPAS
jgi:hypothetical protein